MPQGNVIAGHGNTLIGKMRTADNHPGPPGKSEKQRFYLLSRIAYIASGKSDAFWGQHIHNVSAMFDALDDLRDTHKEALDEESEPSLQQKEAALQAVQQFVAKYQFEQRFPNFGLEYSSQPFLNW